MEVKENLEGLLKVDPLAVALGIGLVKMIQAGPDAPILKRLNGIRKQLVLGLGFFLPPVRFIDGTNLRHREYAILIRGNEVARYEMVAGCDLAVPNEENVPKIAGTVTREPSFGMPAVWTPSANSMQARNSGYTVVDQVSVMGTHLMEVVRSHAHELFGLQEMKKLLDLVAAENPKVVEEVVPKLLSLAVVHRVFQNLLRERISIRDAVTILEAAGEASLTTKNVVLITEYARQAIRRSIVQPFLDREEKLRAYVLDAALDEAVVNSVQHGEITSHLSLAPSLVREFIKKIEEKVGNSRRPGRDFGVSRRALFPAATGGDGSQERLLPVAQRCSANDAGGQRGVDPLGAQYEERSCICKPNSVQKRKNGKGSSEATLTPVAELEPAPLRPAAPPKPVPTVAAETRPEPSGAPRIKTYVAESVPRAMTLARSEMGEDAILIQTRRRETSDVSKQFEVTFGIVPNSGPPFRKPSEIAEKAASAETTTEPSAADSEVARQLGSLRRELAELQTMLRQSAFGNPPSAKGQSYCVRSLPGASAQRHRCGVRLQPGARVQSRSEIGRRGPAESACRSDSDRFHHRPGRQSRDPHGSSGLR